MTRRRLFGGHRRDGPEQLLKGYAGYLQADALAQYTGRFAAGAVVHVACNAHARRRFVEAQVSAPNRPSFPPPGQYSDKESTHGRPAGRLSLSLLGTQKLKFKPLLAPSPWCCSCQVYVPSALN